MENIRYEIWLQNQDKFVAQCTIVPIRKHIGSIKFISDSAASPDMNLIDTIFFRIGTIVHCVTNSIGYPSAVDGGYNSSGMSGKTKNYQIGICCLYHFNHAALRSKD
jgi:hypothetical protein